MNRKPRSPGHNDASRTRALAFGIRPSKLPMYVVALMRSHEFGKRPLDQLLTWETSGTLNQRRMARWIRKNGWLEWIARNNGAPASEPEARG
jgi:hypothetical protein